MKLTKKEKAIIISIREIAKTHEAISIKGIGINKKPSPIKLHLI